MDFNYNNYLPTDTHAHQPEEKEIGVPVLDTYLSDIDRRGIGGHL